MKIVGRCSTWQCSTRKRSSSPYSELNAVSAICSSLSKTPSPRRADSSSAVRPSLPPPTAADGDERDRHPATGVDMVDAAVKEQLPLALTAEEVEEETGNYQPAPPRRPRNISVENRASAAPATASKKRTRKIDTSDCTDHLH